MPRSRLSIHGGVPLTTTTPTTTTKTASTSSSSSSPLAAPTATYSLFPSDPFTGRSYSARPSPQTRPRTNTRGKDPRPPSISPPPRPASVSLPHIAMLLNKPLPSSPTRQTAPAVAASSSSSKATNDKQAPAPAPIFSNSDDMLRWLYADLTRISQVATPDIILHRVHDHSRPLRGAAAAQAHEEGLVAAAGGTLVMEVDRVSSNEHFGTVMGTLRAQSRHKGVPDLAAPFCGVWRFDGKGKLAEHWENVAVDPDQVAQWFENNARQQQ
ncbi:hypothetical protein PG984_004013 [Apiospora sp. TS-2023a]